MNMRNSKAVVIILAAVLLLSAILAGGWLWYDNNVDRSGWETAAGIRYYKDFHGDRVTGWREIDGETYYFTGDNAMATLWHEVEGQVYFFREDGTLATGWETVGEKTHYFSNDGIFYSGWLDLEGKRYYLPEGILVTGWQDIDGNRYYFGSDGAMATGTVDIDGVSYTFREDGTMVTGWHEGKYILSDGTTASGWQDIDGKRCYFREDGSAYTGWLEEGEYRYYIQQDGTAAVGPLEIDGYTYHFSPKGVQIWLVNHKYALKENYEPETTMINGYPMASECVKALENMLGGCRIAGNADPIIVAGYRTYWDQHYMYNHTLETVGPSGFYYISLPNHSEHQLGLAVDIVENSHRTLNNSQEYTASAKWLRENCWDYGFILRYPEGTRDITGVAYEPWHYRYVGKEIALELKELGITLEEYLGAA